MRLRSRKLIPCIVIEILRQWQSAGLFLNNNLHAANPGEWLRPVAPLFHYRRVSPERTKRTDGQAPLQTNSHRLSLDPSAGDAQGSVVRVMKR